MGVRNFDGHRVEETLARLAGTFGVDEADADLLIADHTVVAVVVARVTGAAEKIMRTGVVRRTNVLDVSEFAIVREPELQRLLIEHMPQLENPVTPPEAWGDDDEQQEEVAWVPPAAVEPEPLPPAPPVEDEEVFSPSGGTTRIPVGGARRNDPVLSRFLNGSDR